MEKEKGTKDVEKRGRKKNTDVDYLRTTAWAHCVARYVSSVRKEKKLSRSERKDDADKYINIESPYFLQKHFKHAIDKAAWHKYLNVGKPNVGESRRNAVDKCLGTDFRSIYDKGIPVTTDPSSPYKKFILPFWAILDEYTEKHISKPSFEKKYPKKDFEKDLNGHIERAMNIVARQILEDKRSLPPLCSVEKAQMEILFYDKNDLYELFRPHTVTGLNYGFPLVTFFAMILFKKTVSVELLASVNEELKHYGLTAERILAVIPPPPPPSAADEEMEILFKELEAEFAAASFEKMKGTSWDKSSGKREGGGRKS
ncbi:hypothetical protein [Desulfovibrio aminophilus]|uniref:hypothetical protein n=1 Tax=Desulfovibrio aminophilus TaxID=81425 RepID=UPI0012EB9285|nr:hypothetical protein [Desulfovibrio aminophilus]